VKGRWFGALFIALALIGALVISVYPPIERALVSAGIDVLLGSKVSMRELRIGNEGSVIVGFHAERHGTAVLDVDRIELSYQPRDFFPGGNRRFGLVGFSIEHPSLQLVREPNGSFNLPSAVMRLHPTAQIRFSDAKPLRFVGRVTNGSVQLFDQSRLFAASREQRVDHVDATFTVDSAAITHYELRADYGNAQAQPFRLTGTIDRERRFAMHHFYARSLSISALLNYLMNTSTAVVLAGSAHDLDIRAYDPFIGSDGAASYHISGSAVASDAVLHVVGFRTPVRDLHGRGVFFL
jgi:hypothetical protein